MNQNIQFKVDLVAALHAVLGIINIPAGYIFALMGKHAIIKGQVWGAAAILISLLCPIYLLAAYGLWKRKNWARSVILLLSCFHLLLIPIGTILGLYSIRVLTIPEMEKEFPNTMAEASLAGEE